MSSTETAQRKVLHLSGREVSGAFPAFCRLLAGEAVRLVRVNQSQVHGSLSFDVELEVAASEATVLLNKVEPWAKERGLHLLVTALDAESSVAATNGVWVTVLGDLSSGAALATVLENMRGFDLMIRRVETVGDSCLFGVNILGQKSHITKDELAQIRSTLLGLCNELHVDLAVQRDDIYRTSKRLLCMDVDSTFVKGEFIDELAELCGVKPQVAEITARAMRGELDFEAALRERVKLLKGLPMSRARELCERFELTPGAEDLVRNAKRLGMRVGLVSGGFDFFVEALKEKFNLDFTFANELEVEDDKLTGNVIGTIVDSHRKAQVLKDMAHVFDVRLEQTIAAGDGANDIQMLQTAGLGIAYQAKPLLQQVADTRFNASDRLDSLLYLMGFDAKKLAKDPE